MNPRLVAYEHQTLRLVPDGPLTVDAHQALLDLIPRLPSGAITATHGGVRTSSYCGLIQAGDWVLEILPKIYGDERQAPNRGLLVRMLGTCFDLPIWQHGLAESELADDLLLILIRTFLDEALIQVRQGPLKSYVRMEEQLTRPRGRLNLAEQIRRGRAQAHRMHCEFDELTADNGFNQAVKAALLASRGRLPLGSALRARADQLFILLGDISTVKMTATDIEALPRNRLTRRYDRLLSLASWLVQLLGPDVHGGGEQGLSLLFDMNQLFQDYVAAMLTDAIQRHPERHRFRLTCERPVVPLLRDQGGNGLFMLRPDFCLWLDDRLLVILDTKWKRLSPDDPDGKIGISQSDLYQLLAYGHTYTCKRLALIYPFHNGLIDWIPPSYRFAPHDDSAIELSVAIFDLDRAEQSSVTLLSSHDPASLVVSKVN